MKKIFVLGVILAAFSFVSSPVSAQIRQPQAQRPRVELPLFVAGDNKTIDQPVNKDLMMAGNNVNVDANVSGDAYVAGGQVNIKGNIGGDLIVAGGTVNLSGDVTKNLIMAGGRLNVEQGASIGGYVLGAGDKLNLDGTYAGTVKIASNELTVGDQTKIAGNLEADVAIANIASTAAISGERKVNIHETKKPNINIDTGKVAKSVWGWWQVMSFLGSLLVLLVLVALRGGMRKPAAEALKMFWSTLGWGLVVLIITPFVIMALFTTLVGIPLSIIVAAMYFIGLYISGLVVSIALGKWFADKGWLNNDNKYIQAIAGLVVISIIGIVPVIGWLAKFVILLLGLGIMYRLGTTKTEVVKTKK